MTAYNTKPKSVGSAYINTKKGSDQEVIDAVAQAVNCLKEAGAYLRISIKSSTGEYVPLTGFFNNFKQKDKDADIIIRATQVATQTKQETNSSQKSTFRKPFRPQAPTPPPVQSATIPCNDQFDEGIPF